MQCLWLISTSEFDQLILKFEEIDVEYYFDYILVGDGNDPDVSNSIQLHLTGKLPPLTMLSPNNTSWIKFRSDYSITGRGFRVYLTIREQGGKFDGNLYELVTLD